jgi:uncharacterized membrane protein YjgN (DUF898 family)
MSLTFAMRYNAFMTAWNSIVFDNCHFHFEIFIRLVITPLVTLTRSNDEDVIENWLHA